MKRRDFSYEIRTSRHSLDIQVTRNHVKLSSVLLSMIYVDGRDLYYAKRSDENERRALRRKTDREHANVHCQ